MATQFGELRRITEFARVTVLLRNKKVFLQKMQKDV